MGERADAELAKLDPDELQAQLGARLTTLPPDAYLRCVAAFVAEYQGLYHVSGLPEALYRSVDAIVALAARAAAGLPVRDAASALDRTFTELLDRTAAWLHSQGIPEWLTWPDRQDTVAASISRGEVWLLGTATGDVAATATLSTADPGPGRWDETDRGVAATHLSRLAVRPDFLGQGVGTQLLEWARVRAYRDGSSLLRVAAWPRVPDLHAYLRRRGFLELWTVAGPPATARTLFARPTAPDGTVVRVIEHPPRAQWPDAAGGDRRHPRR